MGSEEDTPIRPVFEQIVGRFGRVDLAVRISFPLPSCLIFTLTPAPADPNMHFLLPRALQPHPRIALRRSDHPQQVLSRKSLGKHWGCRALSDVVGIGETVRLETSTSE